MKIKVEDLENGGEIDFTANFTREGRIGRGRVSLRKKGEKYQVYVKWFNVRRRLELREIDKVIIKEME